jgi:hypothetical protein
LELIVETVALTPVVTAAMCVARDQPELICDRCQDPDEIVVSAMAIEAIDKTFALCGNCTRELPSGFQVA